MNKLTMNFLIATGVITALTAIAGCEAPADRGPEAKQVIDLQLAQAAAGSREDATLNASHFDGAKLNSLGEEKLHLIMADDDTAKPVTVYINVAGDDAHSAGYRDAVSSYLSEQGLAQSDVRFAMGPNPASLHAAARNIKQYDKLETAASTSGDTMTMTAAPAGGTPSK